MSYSIFYKGTLNPSSDRGELLHTVAAHASQYKWIVQSSADGNIVIEIPDCEPLVFFFNDGQVDKWVKCFAQGASANIEIEKIFDLLWGVKPLFKALDVQDDDGLWDAYVARRSPEKMIFLRELKDSEVAELKRDFDLPREQTSIFRMTKTKAVLMWMICKDMNPNLQNPLQKQEVLKCVDPRAIVAGPPDEPIEKQEEYVQFIAVVESWILSKLTDEAGAPLPFKKGAINSCTYFSWVMAEIIFGFGGGILGSEHSKLHRFVESILQQGYDLEDEATFLRMIYSILEYVKVYRPDALIERTRCTVL